MNRRRTEIIFEESLSDDWSGDLETIEIPLDNRPLFYVAVVMGILAFVVAIRILFLGWARADYYGERVDVNLGKREIIIAPRGLITDRFGEVVADNISIFSAYLVPQEYMRHPELQEKTKLVARETLETSEEQFGQIVTGRDFQKYAEPIPLAIDLTPAQVVTLKEAGLPTILVRDGYRRNYPQGRAFSSVLGYIGLTSSADLAENFSLSNQDFVGKTGLEFQYDERLRGRSGLRIKMRDARGNILEEQEKTKPVIGNTLRLTIDGELQGYFYRVMNNTLVSLGRTSGVGMAMNPQTGEILALVNFPVFDNNIFSSSAQKSEIKEVLSSEGKPLFNRAVSGAYSPGSTIKPLVALAALKEGVVTPVKSIFSPGYLEIPNPYNPDQPTRFPDWRPQGWVNVYSALAQSSNVYFYEVGGGFGDIRGLGITRLKEWWGRLGLGKKTGIDMPGEAEGFLPDPEWKEKSAGRPWRLGDTYNVSIGQGDLLVTPIQLLNYISVVANGGILHQPFLANDAEHKVLADLTYLSPEIKEVQKGMRLTVTAPLGTANKLNDLTFTVAAKTGTAQIKNNTKENAFFAGYIIPEKNPSEESDLGLSSVNTGSPLAILVLVENAKPGGLNAVPIAKDVLNWYYEHRMKEGDGKKEVLE
ncbi:MAG: penicillin-binding protein 2 [Candidatus Liptonbacteria bacterium]